MGRRVVITGTGAITPLGNSCAELWQAVIAGKSGVSAHSFDDVGEVAVGRADDPDAEAAFGRRDARRMDRVGRFATLAAAEALSQSGELGLPPEEIGASIACCHGGIETLTKAASTMRERGAEKISPLAVPLLIGNSPVAAVARIHGLRGPSLNPGTACASASDAIGQAAALIRSGRAQAMVAGGAEAPLVPLLVAAYRQLGALTGSLNADASRPFDRERDGFAMAEGAGVLVLEERERALARGAKILCELVGYGSSCDAGHVTDPDPDGSGPIRAISEALADAGVDAGDIGYVNAHATSTPSGDLAEAKALTKSGLTAPVSATKSMTGHLMGASGGAEAVITTMAVQTGVLPPTAHLDDPEPDPSLDHLLSAREEPVALALSNSFGFGGHNACLVFRAAE